MTELTGAFSESFDGTDLTSVLGDDSPSFTGVFSFASGVTFFASFTSGASWTGSCGVFGVHLTLMKEQLSSWVKWKRMAGTSTIPWLPRLSGRKEMTRMKKRE